MLLPKPKATLINSCAAILLRLWARNFAKKPRQTTSLAAFLGFVPHPKYLQSCLPLVNQRCPNFWKARFLRLNRERLFFAFLCLLVLCVIPKNAIDGGPPLCLFRLLFDKQCWGCGTTRAVWSVLHLNFLDAWNYNKAIVVTFPLLSGCTLGWICKPMHWS